MSQPRAGGSAALRRSGLAAASARRRFYARSQIKTTISVSLLRSLDVPIPAIKAILATKAPHALAERLEAERRPETPDP